MLSQKLCSHLHSSPQRSAFHPFRVTGMFDFSVRDGVLSEHFSHISVRHSLWRLCYGHHHSDKNSCSNSAVPRAVVFFRTGKERLAFQGHMRLTPPRLVTALTPSCSDAYIEGRRGAV